MLIFDPPELKDQITQAIQTLTQITKQNIGEFAIETIDITNKNFDPTDYDNIIDTTSVNFDPAKYEGNTITSASRLTLSFPNAPDCKVDPNVKTRKEKFKVPRPPCILIFDKVLAWVNLEINSSRNLVNRA